MIDKQRNQKKSLQEDFVLVGKTEYHDLTTNSESSMEQILILRDDGIPHVLSLNRLVVEALIRECQVPGSGFISNYKKKKKGQHAAKGVVGGQQQRQAQVKAIQTTTRTVCPDCNAELEVSLNLEVEGPKQQRGGNNNWNDKSAAMFHYLQFQTKKKETQIQALTRERDSLKVKNQKIQEASKEAFEVLNNFAQKQNAEASQFKKELQQQEATVEELQQQQALADKKETAKSAAREQIVAQLKTSAIALKKDLAQAKVDTQKELEAAHAASANWNQQFLQQQRETAVVCDMLEKLRGKYRTLSRQLREICPTPSFKM